jgi:hypothetical protein
MPTADPALRPTAIRVLLVEAAVIAALWWIGRYFG